MLMSEIKKPKKKKIIAAVLISLTLTLICFSVWFFAVYGNYYSHIISGELTEEKLKEANIDSCDRLMIVAHPDDDLLWGGAHLADRGYFVLCLTNNNNSVRRTEFENMKKTTGNCGLILSYPDKLKGKRSDWKRMSGSIRKDLDLIISYKEWDVIVTHNPAGEYGHIHHKWTSRLVTDVCEESRLTERLSYFGKFYWKKYIPDDLERLSDEKCALKREWIKIYTSQQSGISKFIPMLPYENWVSYEQWNADETQKDNTPKAIRR